MIFPAIDLLGGQSVRLYKGDYKKVTIIDPSPAHQAKAYEDAGVGALHLVDLDGAKAGKPINTNVIRAVRQAFTGILEIGGGIRDQEAVDLYMDMGLDRIILGSVALKNPIITKALLAKHGGDRIVIGVDGFDGKVATEGWLDQSEVAMDALIGEMMAYGAKHFIVTDVDRDGTMQGANEDLLQALQHQFPQANIIASGGVRHVADIQSLQAKGIKDAVIGKALYEGTITLEEIAHINGKG